MEREKINNLVLEVLHDHHINGANNSTPLSDFLDDSLDAMDFTLELENAVKSKWDIEIDLGFSITKDLAVEDVITLIHDLI